MRCAMYGISVPLRTLAGVQFARERERAVEAPAGDGVSSSGRGVSLTQPMCRVTWSPGALLSSAARTVDPWATVAP